MSLPYITLLLPQGTSILVQLEDTDGQFVISYGDPGATPKGMDVEAVRVMSDLPDSTGREGIIYEELFGSPPEEDEAVESEQPLPVEPVSTSQTPAPVFKPPVVNSLRPPSIEELLARNIARDPETGTLPTEPAPEALERAQNMPLPASPTATPAPADGVETTVEPVQQTVSAVTLPPGARAMDDGAPRGGEWVFLYSYDIMNNEILRQPAQWSSTFGRQFWVDEDDESLGMDSSFDGWKLMTVEEKEEHGIS